MIYFLLLRQPEKENESYTVNTLGQRFSFCSVFTWRLAQVGPGPRCYHNTNSKWIVEAPALSYLLQIILCQGWSNWKQGQNSQPVQLSFTNVNFCPSLTVGGFDWVFTIFVIYLLKSTLFSYSLHGGNPLKADNRGRNQVVSPSVDGDVLCGTAREGSMRKSSSKIQSTMRRAPLALQ